MTRDLWIIVLFAVLIGEIVINCCEIRQEFKKGEKKNRGDED